MYQAIEGSDEAPLDGNSSLVLVNDGQMEEFRCPLEALGLLRATKAHLAWKSAEDESRRLRAALGGVDGPVRDLLLYNAALRLWAAGDGASLEECLESARQTLESGAVLRLAQGAGPVPVAGR